jgi:hypothetical protein
MPESKLILCARIHAGSHLGATAKTVTIDPSGGDAEKHLTFGFRPFRASFSFLERVVDAASSSEGDCYSAANQAFKESIPAVFTLAPGDVFAGQAHYWNGERWVKITSGTFGYGFLVHKNGAPYTEKVSINPTASNIVLEVDFVVSIFDSRLV